MDSAGLRALQAPIKDRYKTSAEAAVITLKAKGALDDTNIACKVETGRAVAVAGLHPEGDLDFRGTLGVAKDAPVGFRQIRLHFDLDTDAPQDKLDQLFKLTERYCVVYQTIKNGPPVDIKLNRV